ncbi:MATE family efflux transporter [Rikenella microfusus]|uniref:MATE family efflux transporter n=1 Tax=Rikenella microfusus TaxID=28139 RepID=UPI001D2766DB|nr:MATE family efflux transporter [Rikenella microfusus]HJE88792.1 MATE family efflux transporter [Rikenella microfusus]
MLFTGYKSYYGANLRLAVPVIISQVGQYSVQIVDTVMVGHLGEAVPLAAISFAYALSWPILFLGTGVAMGLTPLVGKSYARGDRTRSASLFKNSLLLGTAMSVVLMSLLGLMIPLMGYMGQDPEILPIARGYMWYQLASALPMMLFASCKQFLEGIGNTAHTMVIAIIGNVLNIVLNGALIYGWWIFPEMGAVGAGASTFIARVVMVLLFARLMFANADYRDYLRQFRKVGITLFRIRRLLNVGFPIAMQLFIEMAALSLMAVVIGLFGAVPQAAHQIAVNLPSLSFMVVTGLSAATTIRVSQDYGLRLYPSMRRAMNASLHMITAFTVCASLMVFLFGRQIAGLFTDEPAVIDIATHLLHFGCIFMVIDGFQGVILGALRGLTEVKRPMYYAIFTYTCISAPVGYICGFVWDMGAAGTWVAFTTGLAVLSCLYYRLFRKRYRSLTAL